MADLPNRPSYPLVGSSMDWMTAFCKSVALISRRSKLCCNNSCRRKRVSLDGILLDFGWSSSEDNDASFVVSLDDHSFQDPLWWRQYLSGERYLMECWGTVGSRRDSPLTDRPRTIEPHKRTDMTTKRRRTPPPSTQGIVFIQRLSIPSTTPSNADFRINREGGSTQLRISTSLSCACGWMKGMATSDVLSFLCGLIFAIPSMRIRPPARIRAIVCPSLRAWNTGSRASPNQTKTTRVT